jgi:hypothetical protein
MTSAEMFGFVDGNLPDGWVFDEDGAIVRDETAPARVGALVFVGQLSGDDFDADADALMAIGELRDAYRRRRAIIARKVG